MASLSRRAFTGMGAGAALTLATAGLAAPATAAPIAPAPTAADPTASGAAPLDPAALRAAISDLSHPEATASQLLVERRGSRWYGTAGTADPVSGRSVRADDRFRAGSVTKAFVATVVLQLWAEGRVDLDAPIRHCLPGLALPARFDRVEVAHLLQHTSGLPDHRGLPDLGTPEAVLRHRFDHWTPRALVATVTRDRLKFRPGHAQEYRGINYVFLALLIEELTGRPYGEVIASRILRPLGLTGTRIPGGDPRLHGPSVHGFLRMTDADLRDVTVYDQSAAWGEGELVSTADDLFRFQEALFGGVLLPGRALRRMVTLPAVPMLDGTPARYGMGLQAATVNGTTFWGKTGETYGYRTRVFATSDLSTRFVLSYTPTALNAGEDMIERVVGLLTT
ncbi:serine hydrolase domain-containing protein [Streptomyces argyrophylli]|uniref:Beta-lactamase family protein n=1 Tax=Streptomyces argyrophylli TaxID=2726118 RepID=A0A6M4PNJ9_9ACTN|nr:serine hydrolase domain-containing protein [Streptomyces argyrophyllae]QJS11256.1 beta-lactamase family protein [Streptomyces argyrophyllae]